MFCKNRESTSHHTKNLHWLKIKERIEFKVLLLVYKTLTGISPEYATTLINYNHISGSLCHRPSSRPQMGRELSSHACTKEKVSCRPEKNFTWYCLPQAKSFERFLHVKRPRTNLVIKVNFRGSFEIDSKTGVLIAEL